MCKAHSIVQAAFSPHVASSPSRPAVPVRLLQNPQQAMFLTSSTVVLVSLRFAFLWYLDLPSHLRCHPGHRLQLFLYHKTEIMH